MSLVCCGCLDQPALWIERETGDAYCSHYCQREAYSISAPIYKNLPDFPSPLRVRVITWNVGDKPHTRMKRDIDWSTELNSREWNALIPPKNEPLQFDILLVTVQEDKASGYFGKAIKNKIGDLFDSFQSVTIPASVPGFKFFTRAYAFSYRTLRGYVTQQENQNACLKAACTKGTAAISLLFGHQLQLIFMGSHFPVDTKDARTMGYKDRVAAAKKTLSAVYQPLRDSVANKQASHVAFWAGDLNFRDMGGTEQGARALKEKVFGSEFREAASITFPPTCKMVVDPPAKGGGIDQCSRSTSDTRRQPGCYASSRAASWCDRILRAASPAVDVKTMRYASYADPQAVQESDHNLVYADFEIKMT